MRAFRVYLYGDDTEFGMSPQIMENQLGNEIDIHIT